MELFSTLGWTRAVAGVWAGGALTGGMEWTPVLRKRDWPCSPPAPAHTPPRSACARRAPRTGHGQCPSSRLRFCRCDVPWGCQSTKRARGPRGPGDNHGCARDVGSKSSAGFAHQTMLDLGAGSGAVSASYIAGRPHGSMATPTTFRAPPQAIGGRNGRGRNVLPGQCQAGYAYQNRFALPRLGIGLPEPGEAESTREGTGRC
jgi:hypothetical protein